MEPGVVFIVKEPFVRVAGESRPVGGSQDRDSQMSGRVHRHSPVTRCARLSSSSLKFSTSKSSSCSHFWDTVVPQKTGIQAMQPHQVVHIGPGTRHVVLLLNHSEIVQALCNSKAEHGQDPQDRSSTSLWPDKNHPQLTIGDHLLQVDSSFLVLDRKSTADQTQSTAAEQLRCGGSIVAQGPVVWILRSMTMLGQSPGAWKAGKQPLVAMSVCEAELLEGSNCALLLESTMAMARM